MIQPDRPIAPSNYETTNNKSSNPLQKLASRISRCISTTINCVFGESSVTPARRLSTNSPLAQSFHQAASQRMLDSFQTQQKNPKESLKIINNLLNDLSRTSDPKKMQATRLEILTIANQIIPKDEINKTKFLQEHPGLDQDIDRVAFDFIETRFNMDVKAGNSYKAVDEYSNLDPKTKAAFEKNRPEFSSKNEQIIKLNTLFYELNWTLDLKELKSKRLEILEMAQSLRNDPENYILQKHPDLDRAIKNVAFDLIENSFDTDISNEKYSEAIEKYSNLPRETKAAFEESRPNFFSKIQQVANLNDRFHDLESTQDLKQLQAKRLEILKIADQIIPKNGPLKADFIQRHPQLDHALKKVTFDMIETSFNMDVKNGNYYRAMNIYSNIDPKTKAAFEKERPDFLSKNEQILKLGTLFFELNWTLDLKEVQSKRIEILNMANAINNDPNRTMSIQKDPELNRLLNNIANDFYRYRQTS